MENNKLLSNRLKMIFLLSFLVFGYSFVQAQTTKVSGIVKSAQDQSPLIGVNILIKGKNAGAVTDFDGAYELAVNKGDVLIFSALGFDNLEIPVGDQTTIDITLNENVSQLDEVVVVGYGSQKRLEISGSVASVKGEEVQKFTSNNFQDALQGKVAGVTVLSASGQPGGEAVIQIRGVNTLSSRRRGRGDNPNLNLLNPTANGLSPLYIVDGIQLETNPNLSSSEIENIQILKDAATTSIYGTRGAAGVIIITTKKGKTGKAQIEFNASTGVKKITSRINLVNTADAFLIHRTIHDNNTPTQRYFSILEQNKNALDFDTDWQDFILNDFAQTLNSNLRVSGGGSDVNYNVVVDNYKEDGIYKGSDFERTNLRTNATLKKGKFTLVSTTNLSAGGRKLAAWGLLYDAIRLSPYAQPFEIGNPNISTPSGAVQPNGDVFTSVNNVSGELARKFAQDARRREFNFGSNLSLSYKILEPLSLKLNISGYRDIKKGTFYNPRQEIRSEETGEVIANQSQPASLTNYNTTYQAFNRDAILDYDQFFGEHRVSLLLGAEYRELLWEEFRISGNTFASPEQRTITNARNITQRQFNSNPSTSNSFFSRFKYEYGGKYFILANVRRNGTSKFLNNKIGYFGGVSGAWLVSEEGFFKNTNFLSFISNLKFRASWGTVGNDRIPDFRFQSALLSNANPVFAGGGQFGATRFDIGNPNLRWETTESTNFGVDIGLFQGALTITGDYYIAEKEDLLFQLPTVPSAGVQQRPIALNIAELTNTGLELGLNYQNNKHEFKWTIGATFTKNENVVDKLTGSERDVIAGGFPLGSNNNVVQAPVTFIRPGYSAGAFFLIPTDGIIRTQEELDEYDSLVTDRLGRDNKIGDLRYIDNNGDGIINDDDRIFMGNNLPDFETGLSVDFRYKNFDLNMQWFGMFGHKVFNGPKNLAYAFGTHKDIAYQFSALNPNSSIPARRQNGVQDPNLSSASDLFLEDGDFVRLRTIQLGYTLPKDSFESIGLNKLRIYISAQNLLTITEYSGYDPEIGGDGLATRGVDSGLQPVTAQGIFGIQLGF